MSRERVLYRETYRKGAVRLNAASLPVLRHQSTDGRTFKAVACELLAAGQVERADGQTVEYQDLRVYVETSA
jgi:hypothetical protein